MPTQLDLFPYREASIVPTLEDVRLTDIQHRGLVHVSDALRVSIESNGVLIPVSLDSNYNIIDGRRRVQALINLDRHSVSALVYPHGNEHRRGVSSSILLSSNMVRSHNVIGELAAIEQLISETGATPDGIAERLGLSRRMVHNRLRLRGLQIQLRRFLQTGRITLGAALVLAGRSASRQDEIGGRLVAEPAFRPTGAWLRSHFGIAEEDAPQLSLLPDDVEQGVGFAVAVALAARLIQAIPAPEDTEDPGHVEDIIFRLNEVAELLHAMTE